MLEPICFEGVSRDTVIEAILKSGLYIIKHDGSITPATPGGNYPTNNGTYNDAIRSKGAVNINYLVPCGFVRDDCIAPPLNLVDQVAERYRRLVPIVESAKKEIRQGT